MSFGKLKDNIKNYIKTLDSKESTTRFRVNAYNRVIDLIDNNFTNSEKVTQSKLNALELTENMKEKIDKLMHTRSRSKSVKRVTSSKAKKINHDELLNDLTNFMGIGKERAKQLIKEGLENINQLHMKKWLNKLPNETQLFLKYKPVDHIPHEELCKIVIIISKIDIPKAKVEFVGSFRRKKVFSSDLDVMLISSDEHIIEKYLHTLQKHFQAYPYSKGLDKLSIIIDTSDMKDVHLKAKSESKTIKLDVFRVPPDEYVPMLLYSTGSKLFNIRMRGKAKRKGMLLNQRGLFKDGKKIEDLNNEKAYFDILDMNYLAPEDRI